MPVSAMLVRLLAMANLCLVFPHVKHLYLFAGTAAALI